MDDVKRYVLVSLVRHVFLNKEKKVFGDITKRLELQVLFFCSQFQRTSIWIVTFVILLDQLASKLFPDGCKSPFFRFWVSESVVVRSCTPLFDRSLTQSDRSTASLSTSMGLLLHRRSWEPCLRWSMIMQMGPHRCRKDPHRFYQPCRTYFYCLLIDHKQVP